MLCSASARTKVLQSPTRSRSGAASRAACSMPLLVRARLVFQVVVDLRCFVLVSRSGEGPARTLWPSCSGDRRRHQGFPHRSPPHGLCGLLKQPAVVLRRRQRYAGPSGGEKGHEPSRGERAGVSSCRTQPSGRVARLLGPAIGAGAGEKRGGNVAQARRGAGRSASANI
jgi:hypothetical protein